MNHNNIHHNRPTSFIKSIKRQGSRLWGIACSYVCACVGVSLYFQIIKLTVTSLIIIFSILRSTLDFKVVWFCFRRRYIRSEFSFHLTQVGSEQPFSSLPCSLKTYDNAGMPRVLLVKNTHVRNKQSNTNSMN